MSDRDAPRPLPRRFRKTLSLPPLRAPLFLKSWGNPEFFHAAGARERRLERDILERAGDAARHRGIDRRTFLASSAGMALSLLTVNQFTAGCADDTCSIDGGIVGGRFVDLSGDRLDADGVPIPDAADVFIFDVQTHHVERAPDDSTVRFLDDTSYSNVCRDIPDCFLQDVWVDAVFMQSETDLALLSLIPAATPDLPLENFEAADSRDFVNDLLGVEAALSQAMVLPNVDLDVALAGMEAAVADDGVAAWKLHTGWGPENRWEVHGGGYRLDDPDVGLPVVDKAAELGVPIICNHVGLPGGLFTPSLTDADGYVAAAALRPDVAFVAFHSSIYQRFHTCEGPYVEGDRSGVNGLITAMHKYGVGPGENLYAELGSVWGIVESNPNRAAHVLGKLLLAFGDDHVLWGSDSIWTGSPQPLIESFLAFEISEAYQEIHGYPALTVERKRKILGENAAALFGIDIVAHTGQRTSRLASARAEVDDALGARRWAVNGRPGPSTRRSFVETVRRQLASGHPG